MYCGILLLSDLVSVSGSFLINTITRSLPYVHSCGLSTHLSMECVFFFLGGLEEFLMQVIDGG